MADAHPNLAYSAVATAPSPAASGTSLVLTAGHGAARFSATPPYNATVWPVGVIPTPANAEIVRVTGRSTDTLTITRTQEGTSARTIVAGDQIAATITAKSLTDIESGTAISDVPGLGRQLASNAGVSGGTLSTTALSLWNGTKYDFAANSLLVGDMIEMYAWGTLIQNSGAATDLTMAVLFDAVVLGVGLTSFSGNVVTQSASARTFGITYRGRVESIGATGTISGWSQCRLDSVGSGINMALNGTGVDRKFGNEVYTLATVDTTQALTADMALTSSTSTATQSATCEGFVIKKTNAP